MSWDFARAIYISADLLSNKKETLEGSGILFPTFAFKVFLWTPIRPHFAYVGTGETVIKTGLPGDACTKSRCDLCLRDVSW
jgi:hypothetical protein